jgi:hypothetical protein
MPRYRYQCGACKKIQMIFHLISEKADTCTLCQTKGQMDKLLSSAIILKTETIDEESVGTLTQEYIEANREVLKQQQEEAKKETYEPS